MTAIASSLRAVLPKTLLPGAIGALFLAGTALCGTTTVQAQGYGYQGRGSELSSLLRAYFPVTRPAAGNASISAKQAKDLVRAVSGGQVLSVSPRGDTYVVKVLTYDTPRKMRTYRVDAKTGEVRR